jgi:hypothetical protein
MFHIYGSSQAEGIGGRIAVEGQSGQKHETLSEI